MALGSARIEGLDAVIRDFTTAAARVQPDAENLVVTTADKAANKMRDLVPIDEGDVLDSITSDDQATRDASGVWAEAGPDSEANNQAFVAIFLEGGTAKMAPRSFVHPAAELVLPEFEQAVSNLPKL